ncbi:MULTISPECIES: DsbA family protein [unclassified Pseudovibrio]|uniref:2-hydroxychromene-2-carboxylate isomerase n=1 Tax=unclassified Pseudovibrio TaxID=2627060 RepID=UPI0007AE9456|nr:MULTISPECIES: DsbA family protein [unclassified Pseudovibrio]KZL02374.1 2-hydroxychromene-2-carboxylate isomerase [Pseudovibrio sp. W74]KZL08082.1 2-hydroxychromene-2-carboxylate isomerase [Pseudovibrio sp. Ad14]
MSFHSAIKSRIAEYITSETRVQRKRASYEKQRSRRGEAHEVHYFHHAADPYAHPTLQILGDFQQHYAVALKIHLISGPPDWAVPERTALEAYASVDAAFLAKHYGLTGRPFEAPDEAQISQAETLMAEELANDACVSKLLEISTKLWSGEKLQSSVEGDKVDQAKTCGDALLAKYGHYLGATFYYGGEWYWGIDRLHYLQDRLHELGLGPSAFKLAPAVAQRRHSHRPPAHMEVDFFLSFRSPYSYLAFDRTCALADRQGVKLNIRPVLPMVMRGLPVPPMKRKYILADAAREARLHAIPFGRICDPLGTAIERGYSLLEFAEKNGRLRKFCSAFMTGVWAKGVDASTDKGLSRILADAGLDWQQARLDVDNEDWRARTEQNRKELTELGLWGVPSFRVGATGIWGQDRLWAVEDAICDATLTVEN